MTQMSGTGIRLELSNESTAVSDLDDINAVLAPYGSRVWPLDLSDVPTAIRDVLGQPTPTAQASAALTDHFLLSRARMLDVIADAGRTPQVEGGGELRTYVSNFDYWYPELYVVGPGTDYTRFDRFHVNVTDHGSGVDEFMQVLHGKGVVVHQRRPDGVVVTVHLDCPSDTAGWLMTYDGALPHIGSLSSADLGTKVLQQIIGSASWAISYVD